MTQSSQVHSLSSLKPGTYGVVPTTPHSAILVVAEDGTKALVLQYRVSGTAKVFDVAIPLPVRPQTEAEVAMNKVLEYVRLKYGDDAIVDNYLFYKAGNDAADHADPAAAFLELVDPATMDPIPAKVVEDVERLIPAVPWATKPGYPPLPRQAGNE